MQFKIIHFPTLASTNDEAMHGLYSHGDIIITDHQTAGRGQRGNSWNTLAGSNLTLSMVVEPHNLKVSEQFRISEITALAAASAISTFGVDCKIKWPNDLYVSSSKIGGILIEHTSMGPYISKSILGIGLNVNQTAFPLNIPNPTSLALLGIQTTPSAVLDRLMQSFAEVWCMSPVELHQRYISQLWRSDGFHHYRDITSGSTFRARITKIDPNTGCLTLDDDLGNERQYWFKEVEAVLDQP